MGINGEHFDVEENGRTVTLRGIIRFNGVEEYKQMLDIFQQVAQKNNGNILLDICGLNLLNSSGITSLCKFAIQCRKDNLHLSIKWNDKIQWQSHTVKNLQRLSPGLELIRG